MPENEKTIWGIHAGKTGDADSLFLKKNYIALLATVLMFALPAIHAVAGCPESLSQESMAELIKKHFQNEIPKDSERAFSELMRSGVISPFFARPPSGPAPL
ncbi:MAG TPA: hypothetical protein VFM35_08645, partial [Candidatus Binatia bacterium]|nr:hypothetical protein [Candidatus Binatia bacterium]